MDLFAGTKLSFLKVRDRQRMYALKVGNCCQNLDFLCKNGENIMKPNKVFAYLWESMTFLAFGKATVSLIPFSRSTSASKLNLKNLDSSEQIRHSPLKTSHLFWQHQFFTTPPLYPHPLVPVVPVSYASRLCGHCTMATKVADHKNFSLRQRRKKVGRLHLAEPALSVQIIHMMSHPRQCK